MLGLPQRARAHSGREETDHAAEVDRLRFVALGLIWGSNFIFMKWASETITAGQITLLRVLFGFLPVLVYGVIREAFDRGQLRYVPHFLVMSLIATSIYYFAFAAGTSLLPSGVAGALSGAIPLFSFLSAAFFLRSEQITLARLLGILIGFSGVLLIARPWATTSAVRLMVAAYTRAWVRCLSLS